MADKEQRSPKGQLQWTYMGRQIDLSQAKGKYRLLIDGREIHMEQRESGVISHEFTFMEFGSPQELAEALIRQWGTAKIDFTPMSPDAQAHAGHMGPRAQGHEPPKRRNHDS